MDTKHAVFCFVLFGINRMDLILKILNGFTTECGRRKIVKQ